MKHSSNDPDPAGVPVGYPDGDPVLYQFLDDPKCPMGVSAAPAFMINKCRYTGSPMPHMPGRKQSDACPSSAVTGDNTMGLPTMPIFNCKLHCKPTAVASGYAEYYNVAIVCQQNHRMIYPVPNNPESRTHDACCICGSQPPPLANKDLKSGAWRYKIVLAPLAMNSEHGFMHSHPQFV